MKCLLLSICERRGRVMDKIKGKDIEKFYFQKRSVRIFALFSGLICAALFSIATVAELELEKGVYSQSAVFAPIAEIACVLLCFASAVLCFILVPKEKESESLFPEENRYHFYFRFDPVPLKAVRYVTALVIFLEGMADFIIIFSGAERYILPPVLEVVRLLAAFALTLYFVPEIADISEAFFGKIHLYCGSAGVLWFFITIIREYFATDTPFSSSYRIMEQIVLVTCLLGLIFDIKLRTGAFSVKRRLAFLSVGFIAGFGFNFARVMMMLFGKMPSASDMVLLFVELAISIYFGAKLVFYSDVY